MNDISREVPVFSITDTWDTDDIKTIQDCDDAEAILTESIISIETQLETDKADGFVRDPKWRISATGALKFKKRAMQFVARRRGEIGRDDRRAHNRNYNDALLTHIKQTYPAEYLAAVAVLRAQAV